MLATRLLLFFFFQAEDGIRDYKVTGVQTCALPIYQDQHRVPRLHLVEHGCPALEPEYVLARPERARHRVHDGRRHRLGGAWSAAQIGRASCRGRGEISGVAGSFKKKKEEAVGAVLR